MRLCSIQACEISYDELKSLVFSPMNGSYSSKVDEFFFLTFVFSNVDDYVVNDIMKEWRKIRIYHHIQEV